MDRTIDWSQRSIGLRGHSANDIVASMFLPDIESFGRNRRSTDLNDPKRNEQGSNTEFSTFAQNKFPLLLPALN